MTAPDTRCERCPDCGRERADATNLDTGLCEVAVSFASRTRRASKWNLEARQDCLRADIARRERALEALAWRAKVEPLIEAVRAEIDRQVAARGSLGCEDLRRIGALLAATAPTKEHA